MEKVYVNPDHSSQLLAQVSVLWKRDKYCDAALNLGSTRYKLHKLVLVAVCPDIMRLLLHTEENNVFDFYVPSKHDRSAVENVLKYLYEGVIQLTEANVNGIEKFSRTLQLQSLIRYCIHYKTSLKNGCKPDDDEQVFHASVSMQMSNNSPAPSCVNNINMTSSGNLRVPNQAIQKTAETRNPFCVLGAPDIMRNIINCPLNSLLNTVPVSVKSETDTSDIEILEDAQTNLIRSVTFGEKEIFSNGATDFEELPSSNNGQLTRYTDVVPENFTAYSSSNLISNQGDVIRYLSADNLRKQDETTLSSSFQHNPAHGASGFMEVLPVDSVLKQFSDKNSELVTLLTGNDSVKDNTYIQQRSQNSDQSTSSLDKSAVYFTETNSENIARCKKEKQTNSSTFIMVCESLSAHVKDKAKPESNLLDSHHTDPFLEDPPSYQGSDLHNGMQVGSRTYTLPYTENSTRSDISIQNSTKNNSMSTHSVQCSLDDSEEDIDMEAESDLEETSADSTTINRSFPQGFPCIVLPNIGTSLTALKKCLKKNRLPSDIEIGKFSEENEVDAMILGEIEKSTYHPGSTNNVISSKPYVDKTVAGKVTQAGLGSKALPNSQANKHSRQPESVKRKVSIVRSASIHEQKKNPKYKQPIDLVFVPGVSKKDDGRRIYNKELACLYCGKLLKHRLKSHLATQHSEEKEVASLLACSKMEQDKGFQLIKNKGNFKHNIKVLEQGEGKLIVVRRSTQSSRNVEYLPCIHCMGFFRCEDLWRHCGRCPFSTEEEKDINVRSSLLAKSRVLLAGGLSKKITLIEPSMTTDLTSFKAYEKR
ncbi:hypothetical protein ACJMK2_019987 [Sinanodonta woodiana]|uniref:BTB domain-containing protein n=1 Tax=Sinanodonta woodiana TaxID=1069815 RepID=A0ABD3TXP7_SINWO